MIMMIHTNEYVYSKRSFTNETGTQEKLLQRVAKKVVQESAEDSQEQRQK